MFYITIISLCVLAYAAINEDKSATMTMLKRHGSLVGVFLFPALMVSQEGVLETFANVTGLALAILVLADSIKEFLSKNRS